ncbi:MAG: hypothetical protein AB1458_15875 [Bacteroidota bacterium]
MKNRIIIVVSVLLTVGGLVWLFYYLNDGGNKYKWYEDYRMSNKEPYGGYVISELLRSYYKNEKFEVMKKSFSETMKKDSASKAGKNYVFIGENIFLDSASLQDLLKFVKKGNNAFIASKDIPEELMHEIYDYVCNPYWQGYSYYEDSLAEMNFYHPALEDKKNYRYIYRIRDKNYYYNWRCIDGSYFCDEPTRFIPLGYLHADHDSKMVNFAKINYGKGHVYLHTSPLVFTNFFLVSDTGVAYAEKVFSHLQPGTIYWDEYSRVPHYEKKKSNDPWDNDRGNQGESPLQYILAQPGLKWAWYMMFALALVYLLFRAKRRQRIIPLIEPNVNTSLEFVQTIGRLYFINNDHRKLCIQKMKQFLAFIRARYFVATNNLDEKLIQRIAVKSQVPEEKVALIFKQYNWLSKTGLEITDFELIKFHESMDYFYKNCK